MKLPYPLWEAFPSLTPYHFAYNNPISFNDNSGLVPEKEKGDRILANDPTKGHLLMISFNNSNATDFVIEIMQQCDPGYSFDWDEYYAKQNAKLEGLACNFAIEERYPRLGTAGSNGKSDGAWEIKRDWTDEDLESYQQFYNEQLKLYKEKGIKLDCADLQFAILTDYAAQNGLPLDLKDRNGKSYNMENYNSLDDYKESIKSLNASDITSNTFEVSRKDAVVGDMMVIKIEFRDKLTNVKVGKDCMHTIGFSNLEDRKNPLISYGNHVNGIPTPINYNVVGNQVYLRDRASVVSKSYYIKNIHIPNIGTAHRWNVFKKKGE